MLNISHSQSVGWPSTPPVQAAPVPAVPGVGAAQASARDPQPDSGRGGQGASSGGTAPSTGRAAPEPAAVSPEVQAAPILPRERRDGERSSLADEALDARQRADQRQEEEKTVREKAEQKLQLEVVLASVWKASAAVVDVVLGREADAGKVAVAAEGAQGVSTVAAASLPVGARAALVQDELPGLEPVPAARRREQDPVAYTEQGASSWAPMEAGSLISHRV